MVAALLVEGFGVGGEGAGPDKGLGKGAGLAEVVVGALVILRGSQGTVQAAQSDEDRERERRGLEVLLDRFLSNRMRHQAA